MAHCSLPLPCGRLVQVSLVAAALLALPVIDGKVPRTSHLACNINHSPPLCPLSCADSAHQPTALMLLQLVPAVPIHLALIPSAPSFLYNLVLFQMLAARQGHYAMRDVHSLVTLCTLVVCQSFIQADLTTQVCARCGVVVNLKILPTSARKLAGHWVVCAHKLISCQWLCIERWLMKMNETSRAAAEGQKWCAHYYGKHGG